MASNYPPGVTGFEDAIAGPRDEYTETRAEMLCVHCEEVSVDVEVDVRVWQYEKTVEWLCSNCDDWNSGEEALQ